MTEATIIPVNLWSWRPQSVSKVHDVTHDTQKKEHNLHKLANLSFDNSMAACVFLLQCYCVQFVFRICLLLKCRVTTFCQTLLLVPAICCVYYNNGGQTLTMFWLLTPRQRCCIWQKSCAYSKTNCVLRLGWDKSVINQFTKPYSLSWLFRPRVFW